MNERERAIVAELSALLGGAIAARGEGCSHCAEILRTKTGSVAFRIEVSNLKSTYCHDRGNAPDTVRSAYAALQAVDGHDITRDTVVKLMAAAEVIRGTPRPGKGEKAMLELWIRRPDVFSDSLWRVLIERWKMISTP